MSFSNDLEKLAELHQRGVLSDEEFARAKARILNGDPAPQPQAPAAAPGAAAINSLRRSRNDRWIGGVCGGIANITGLASWVWRLAFVLGTVCAGGSVVIYLLLWILLPEE
ncbi:PspC domain-containing protein [Pelomonas sp. SE-A7]|uniref:PspC domain-containing protein n=1 Tax=Pelomonas sp. SE-A7 TaxID=3054953 RepID=UPI00259C8284|nr:PspC domain-containing protein [Pelomonas sp. SE-A7]MDM4768050.1 PspC domain-containing protein [Pelomonas sp. SE-A7]